MIDSAPPRAWNAASLSSSAAFPTRLPADRIRPDEGHLLAMPRRNSLRWFGACWTPFSAPFVGRLSSTGEATCRNWLAEVPTLRQRTLEGPCSRQRRLTAALEGAARPWCKCPRRATFQRSTCGPLGPLAVPWEVADAGPESRSCRKLRTKAVHGGTVPSRDRLDAAAGPKPPRLSELQPNASRTPIERQGMERGQPARPPWKKSESGTGQSRTVAQGLPPWPGLRSTQVSER